MISLAHNIALRLTSSLYHPFQSIISATSPKIAPSLPTELIELIVEYLLGDCLTLRNCALISRAWTAPSQCALFHDTRLYKHLEVVRLPAHLLRYPHLQRLIQRLEVRHTPQDIDTAVIRNLQWQRNDYMSSLAALFLLLAHVTSLDITFDRSRHWDAHDKSFVEAFSAFLRQSECLTELAIHGLWGEVDFQQMFTYLDGSKIQRLSLGAPSYYPYKPTRVDFFDTTLSLARLPAVELLHVNLCLISELYSGLSFWLGHQQAMFPSLKHCEVVASDRWVLGMWLRDILKSTALQLESFRLDLLIYSYDYFYEERLCIRSVFEGLHVRHFKLCIYKPCRGCYSDVHKLIMWFSLSFRHLAESGSTVHFTELTFTFTDLYLEAVSAECAALDEVLSHAAFSGVQRVHFEKESSRGTIITETEHPEVASAIRRTRWTKWWRKTFVAEFWASVLTLL